MGAPSVIELSALMVPRMSVGRHTPLNVEAVTAIDIIGGTVLLDEIAMAPLYSEKLEPRTTWLLRIEPSVRKT